MTISDFSRDAARRYLRSVVLIDDKLFKVRNIPSRVEDVNVEGMPAMTQGPNSGVSDSERTGNGSNEEGENRRSTDHWVDAKSVTEGFAKEGIVCGVYEPAEFPDIGFESDDNFKTLVSVCTKADVFIIDWHLFDGDQNEEAVAHLLAHILKEDNSKNSPKPVRFCAIYTAEKIDDPEVDICERVFRALRQVDEKSAKKVENARKVSAGGLTVCIYAKEEGTASGAIAAKDLAKQIVSDFAKTHEGILPALALQSVASIRNNVKRILDKFPADMDPALVLHAGLTIRGMDISQDVSTLVGDEVTALLDDEKEADETIYDLCGKYIEGCNDSVFEKTGDGELDKAFQTRSTSSEVKQYIQKVFEQRTFFPKDENGPLKTVFKDCKESKNFTPKRRLAQLLGKLVARKSNQTGTYRFGALTALFCCRTNYAESKILRFGTVVKEVLPEGRIGHYYICLMPTCDSIRLTDCVTNEDGSTEAINYRFPFWQLTEVSDDIQGRNYGVVLKGENGRFHPYCAKGKIRESFSLFEFNSQDSIVPFDVNGVAKTVGATHSFEWVTELKSAHIQRMAEFVSREFSRVGLTESEWLRLQVDR